jgi:hypothetical protein
MFETSDDTVVDVTKPETALADAVPPDDTRKTLYVVCTVNPTARRAEFDLSLPGFDFGLRPNERPQFELTSETHRFMPTNLRDPRFTTLVRLLGADLRNDFIEVVSDNQFNVLASRAYLVPATGLFDPYLNHLERVLQEVYARYAVVFVRIVLPVGPAVG